MSSDPRIGSELGGYRIERILGRGGMSIVYLAEHHRLHRKVALKILSPELSEDEGFRTRFIRESEAAASLDHPNIIPIFEAGETDGALYIAMRYVKSTDLAVLIGEQGRLDLGRSVSIVEQAASALDAAHAEGLVHRDVKPANLLVAIGAGPGGIDHVYLSDFGLTKRTATRSGLTRTGSFMGTLDYVPPEQIKGQDTDGRSDQYALACVFFQCLTGRVPFDRGDEAAILFAHLSEPPPSATELRADLPESVDAVIARGMAKEPDERFPTCAGFAEAARSAIPPASGPATVIAAPAATIVAESPEAPTASPAGGTVVAQPPAESGERIPPAPPPRPDGPLPEGARRRRRALIVGLVAAAAVVTIVVLLLVPFGTAPEDVAGTTPEGVSTTEAPATSTTEAASGSTSAPPPPPVSPLVGSWVATDLGDGSTEVLVIREDGSFRVRDEEAGVCSPPGPIVIEDTGEFQGRRLFVGETLADCTQGSGDVTIPEFIIQFDRATDTVTSVNDPTGTVFHRVSPLVGRWDGTDPDGSHVELVINVNGSFRLFDDVASGPCTPPGPAKIVGTGEFRKVDGRDQFVMRDVPLDCIEGEGDTTVPILVVEHDAVADTLFTPRDPEGAVLHRA